MITLRIDSISGHFRIPGQIPLLALVPSYPFCPPSTMQGCLEAFTASRKGSFRGEFRYGAFRPPGGWGTLLRQAQIWASKKKDQQRAPNDYEVMRPVHVEKWYDLSHCVQVRGPWEDKIRETLEKGRDDFFGVLYLGESQDLITWIGETDDPLDKVQWLVPGSQMQLPVKTLYGYRNYGPTLKGFDLRITKNPAWMTR